MISHSRVTSPYGTDRQTDIRQTEGQRRIMKPVTTKYNEMPQNIRKIKMQIYKHVHRGGLLRWRTVKAEVRLLMTLTMTDDFLTVTPVYIFQFLAVLVT